MELRGFGQNMASYYTNIKICKYAIVFQVIPCTARYRSPQLRYPNMELFQNYDSHYLYEFQPSLQESELGAYSIFLCV